jgi:hypothetical protein
MFINTVTLATSSAGANPLVLPLVDGPTNQRTVRRCVVSGVTYVLTIAHQATNENVGTPTNRSVLRLETTKVNSETDKEVKGYAQLVLSFPQDGTLTQSDMFMNVQRMLSFLFNEGDAASNGNIPAELSSSSEEFHSSITRLLNGEP